MGVLRGRERGGNRETMGEKEEEEREREREREGAGRGGGR